MVQGFALSGEVPHHLLWMLRRLHLGVDLRNPAVGADQIADAVRLAGTRVWSRTVGDRYVEARVAEKVERKRLFLLESLVLFRCVIADAKDDRILFADFLDSITEPLPFAGSATGTRTRVKPEDHLLAGKISKGHRFSILIEQCEIRSLVAFLQ